MRLAATYGLRNAVIRPALPLLQAAPRAQNRTINTKPRHERPSPITELINLRPTANHRAQSIGILGGGITGLTTAWHLSRLVPHAKITVYEKTDRLGGWLDSEIVKTDDGEVLFEWGPRSLRPDPAGSGRATLLLLAQLRMEKAIIGVDKTAPASLNRFVYYDGRLVQMPGPNPSLPPFWNAVRNGYKILTEPIFQGVLGSLFAEYWVKPRPSNMMDESVGDFIRRRFGKTAADNIGSAFFHGIYAGDLYKLSARTLLPALWHMETRDPEGAGVLMEMVDIAFKGQGLMQFKHGRYVDLVEAAADQDNSLALPLMYAMTAENSVYTFGEGLGFLSKVLQDKLEKNPNIELKTSSDVTDLKFDLKNKKTTVTTAVTTKTVVTVTNKTRKHDYIVSTLSAGKLASFMQSSATSRGVTVNSDTTKALEEANKSVNVGVVNLYYSNPDLIPSSYRGFGYLIPRSVSTDQNPERALGVIFGSETSGVRGKDAFMRVPNPDVAHIQSMKDMIKTLKERENEVDKPESKGIGIRIEISNDSDTETHEYGGEMKFSDMRKHLESEIAKAGNNIPDKVDLRNGQDTAPGTKLTVMLGGHWWDGWEPSDLPSEAELIDMAKTLLARHLKIMENPLVAKARINKEAIPQYTVGHRQRMASVHRGLMEQFQGRLKVAGPWWQGGVGVNDCILSAHLTAFNIREEWDDETGLKEYTEQEKWLICDRRTQTFAVDPVK